MTVGIPDRGAAFDILVAGGVLVLVLVNTLLNQGGITPVDLVPASGVLVLALRNRTPRAVLVASLVLLFVYLGLDNLGPAMTLPALIALFTTVRTGYWRFAVAVMGPVLGLVTVGVLIDGEGSPEAAETAFLQIGWFVAAGVMGAVFREWRARTLEVEARAAEAERTREETARRRAGEERLRIARELHDSLTHAISVIRVQAGVAVHLARKRGEEVPEALTIIEEASGAATRELRATLEVLRDQDPGDGGAHVTLARLDELAGSAGAAGPEVDVEFVGRRLELPEVVDRAAYRIVQEALTNVARHAGSGAQARVRVRYGTDTVAVTITDDGQAHPGKLPEPGTGTLGMRERVTALGGWFTAGPQESGGFEVRAELPLDGGTV